MLSSPKTVFVSATAPTTADTTSSEISTSGRTACTVSDITALITSLPARSSGSSDNEAISAICLAASVTTNTTSDEPAALATDCVVDNRTFSCVFLRCADCANASPASASFQIASELSSSGVRATPRASSTCCFTSGSSTDATTVVIALIDIELAGSEGTSPIRTRSGRALPVTVSMPPADISC